MGVNLGPIIGGFAADLVGFRWPFYITGILTGSAALWTLARLPEYRPAPSTDTGPLKTPAPAKRGDFKTIGHLFTDPTFLAVSTFTLLVFFTRTGGLHSLVPLRASNELGMSPSQIGLLFSASTGMNMLFILPVGAMADRFGRKAIILPGAAVSIGALLIFATGDYLWLFFLAAAIKGIGSGLSGPAVAAYAGDLAPPGKAGVTMGIYRSFGDLGFVLGPTLLGFIADNTSLGTGLSSNAIMLLAASALLLLAAKETAGRRRARSTAGAP